MTVPAAVREQAAGINEDIMEFLREKMLRLTDEELEESLRRDRQEALKEVLSALRRMHDTFENWFTFEECRELICKEVNIE